MSSQWWAAFGPAETQLECGGGQHSVRWSEGMLVAADHPDAEGELVLAALGGDATPCLELVQMWGRHTDDLTVLALGPRSAADPLTLTAGALDQFFPRLLGRATYGSATPRRANPLPPARTLPLSARLPAAAIPKTVRQVAATGPVAARRIVSARPNPQADRHLELLRLLALGAPFQWRLSGAVAHAWSADGKHADGAVRARPALTAALAGRVMPAAAQWLDIGPGEVDVTLHDGPGWGVLDLSDGSLLARLPLRWLARVWAPGLAVVDGHFVVDVVSAQWPVAQVLAVRTPGREPAELSIREDQGHWTVATTGGDGG